MDFIKALIKNFFDSCSTAEPINDLGDYYRVKRWVQKIKKLYFVFTVLSVIFIFFACAMALESKEENAFLFVVTSPLMILSGWGYATLIMYFPQVIKDVISWGSQGYKMGEQFETTHVQVTHEYGNRYRVSSHTENKGCLFAVIAGIARFMVWAFFCVYIGPFLTFKKLRRSIQNLNNYKAQ